MKFITVLFTLVLLFTGCKKHLTADPPLADEILAGVEISGITVVNHDIIIVGAYNNPSTYIIDIDNDGVDDISLISNIWGSPGSGQHPMAEIECLNSACGLMGFYSNDTIFVNDTTYYYQNNGGIDEIHRITHSCTRISTNDTIAAIDPQIFKMFDLSTNDIISKTNDFKSDTIIFINDSYYSYPVAIQNGDTTTYLYDTYYVTCNDFPADAIKYIGIKMSVNGIEKLGWIKLSITDKYKISIYESALQD